MNITKDKMTEVPEKKEVKGEYEKKEGEEGK